MSQPPNPFITTCCGIFHSPQIPLPEIWLDQTRTVDERSIVKVARSSKVWAEVLCTFIVATQSKGQRQVLLYDFVLPKGKRHFIGFNLHARSRAMSERSNPSHISSPLAFDTCLRPQAMKHGIGLISPAQELPYTHADSLQKHQSLTFHLTGVCVNAETEISTSEMSSS